MTVLPIVLTCPPEWAYGQNGTPDGVIPPESTLVFEIKILLFKAVKVPGSVTDSSMPQISTYGAKTDA